MSTLEESPNDLDFEKSIEVIRRVVKSVGKEDVLGPDNRIEPDLIAIAKTMLTLEKAVYREYEQGSQKEN